MISFISHFRGDTEFRYRNLKNVIKYYGELYPDSEHIIINDCGVPDNRLKEFATNRTKFYFFENPSDYRRCECYNIGIKNAQFDIIVFLDVDVLVSKHQIDLSIRGLQEGIADFIYPYDGRFIDIIDHNLIPLFVDNYSEMNKKFETIIPQLQLNQPNECGLNLIHNASVGGIQISTKKFMIEMRGFNSNQIGWGFDDNWMFNFIQKLGNKIARLNNPSFHMNHDLGSEKTIRYENPYYKNNLRIYQEMINSDKEEFETIKHSWIF